MHKDARSLQSDALTPVLCIPANHICLHWVSGKAMQDRAQTQTCTRT